MVLISVNHGEVTTHLKGEALSVLTDAFFASLVAIKLLAEKCDKVGDLKDLLMAIIGEYLKNPTDDIDAFLDKNEGTIIKLLEMISKKGGEE